MDVWTCAARRARSSRARVLSVGLLLFCSLAAALLHAQAPGQVHWSNDRLSVDAAGAPLAAIIREVARLTGIEFQGVEKLSGEITALFKDLPPREALNALLENVNYVVSERQSGDARGARVLVVRIHSRVGEAPPIPPMTGPIHVPRLEKLIDDEISDATDDEDEAEVEDQEAEVARLDAAGAFGSGVRLETLLTITSDSNPRLRDRALHALNGRSDPRIVPALIAAIGDEDPRVRATAGTVLASANDQSILQKLGNLLEEQNPIEIRISAIRVFALRGDPQSLPYVTRATADSHLVVRETAEQIVLELERRLRASKRDDAGKVQR